MAKLTRFDKFLGNDYSMKWYAPEVFIPNFQAWDQLLARQQTNYDQALSIRQKLPNYLPHREELAGQYRASTETGVDAITEQYTRNGVSAGNRALRDFGQKLNTQWQPGGLAFELNQEFADYQGALGKIDQYYKDQKAENSANRSYSLSLLDKAAKGELKQNPQTGMYTRAQLNPNLFPYVDIADEALKVVKEIKGSGTSDIVQMSPAWFLKIQKEDVVTPESIKAVTDALLQQPKYQQQLEIEKIQASAQYTPEQLTALEKRAKDQLTTNFDSTISKIDELASSKKADDKKSLQKQLKEMGYYDGPIDGDFGKNSKEALDQYKQDSIAKRDARLQQINASEIIENQIKSSYTAPLIEAFAREKVSKELIYNKQYDLGVRMANQRKNTQDLVTAMQSLKDPATTNYLTSPGLSKPMETFDKIKQGYQQTYSDAKKVFDNTVQWSGLSTIVGSSAPNKIHEITEARMKSGSYEQFKQNAAGLGYTNESELQNVWNFYNGPGADQLRASYLAMQDAKVNMDNAKDAEVSITKKYVETAEGKKHLEKIRNRHGLKGVSDADMVNIIVNNPGRLTNPATPSIMNMGLGSFAGSGYKDNGDAKEFIAARDGYVNKNKMDFPVSLRGRSINATKGEGAELEANIVDDLTSGHTIGYTGDDKPLVFTSIDGSSKYDDNDVRLDKGNMRFNVDASGVTYYLTGKATDGKPVSAVVKAPVEHYDRLRNMALQMKKEAAESGDTATDAMANQLFAITTKGPRVNNAVEDAITLTDANTERMYNVIDPQLSKKGDVRTFGNNSRIKGKPVGTEWESGGYTYQKYKVVDNGGNQAFMMTMKTDAGWVPLPNKSGGYYFETAQEAESPVWTNEMMRQLPVEVNQQKIKQTNVSNEDAAKIMMGTSQIINDETDNDNDD